mgnify:CR=1 FL=1
MGQECKEHSESSDHFYSYETEEHYQQNQNLGQESLIKKCLPNCIFLFLQIEHFFGFRLIFVNKLKLAFLLFD